ncbi:hypothetical protein A3Q56_06290 [Intoshia linei]|uniref:BEACH domain-containing protein n=1 Tax=Intoshia linei TaxID=1819745 RepID=A0A177AVH5_9BILA|nr:hypothetical protein A3Q56_06290 [Intoshia linei]
MSIENNYNIKKILLILLVRTEECHPVEYFFLLDSFEMVKRVIAILPIVGVGNQYGLPLSRQTSLLSPPKLFSKSNMTLRWSKREISNFDYLMFLNTIAGRTYNDLNQYFIFPWILTNYDSTELDFSLPSNFRDLSKPIGALNPSRLKYFNDRYKNWDSTKIPSFHYGTHYSTSTFTLNWLVRQEPFTTMYLKIQSGKFDSSRIFQSLAQSWKNCQRDTSDVRELIPEFFYLPEMFLNTCDYNFGSIDSDNKSISDVELPPWASSPEEFVRIHRMALESDMVSCQLHQWIDLIFGYKQSGPEGIKASNIFYHLTYDTTDISKVTDETVREALENQILSYGQTPSNLTKVPHITRASTMHMSPQIFKNQDICCIVKFNSHSDIVKIKFCTLLNKSMKKDGKKSPNPIIIDQVLSSKNFHRRTLEPKYFDQRKYPCENSFIITPDSRFIMASGMNDASFKIFNSDTGKLHQSIYGHYGPVSCMRRFCPLLPNQNFLIATASTDCTIKIWSWNDKEKCIYGNQIEFDKTVNPLPIVTICGHNSVIIDVYIMVEMGIVFSLSTDGILMTHNISGENMQRFSVKSLKFDQNYVKPSNIYVNRDGYMFIAALKPFNNASECECKDDTTSMKSYISVYNYASCRLLRSKPFDLISAAILSKCGNFIVIGSLNGTISILKSHNLENVHSYYPCAAVIRSLELSTDQRFIISGLSDGTLTIYGVNFIRWHQEYEDSFS